MRIKHPVTILSLLCILSVVFLVHLLSFTNINGIYAKYAFGQIQTSIKYNNGNAFHAKGLIGTLVSHLISDSVIRSLGFANSSDLVNSTFLPKSATHNALMGNIPPKIYIAAGTWNLDIADGKVKNLFANFTQVTTAGINPHTHTITNYKPNNSSSSIEFDPKSKTTKITGFVDVLRNGQYVKNWMNIPVKIFLSKDNVIGIDVDPIKTNFHFGGTPLFGIVTSVTNQNAHNNNLRQFGPLSPNNVTNTS